MAASEERSHLLDDDEREADQSDFHSNAPTETTPLLSGDSSATSLRDTQTGSGSGSGSDGTSPHGVVTDDDVSADAHTHTKRRKRRWPSVIAILLLALISLGIIVMAFFVPAAVEEYAKQGTVVEPTNLSLESITTEGIQVRIQANFRLDGSRVQNDRTRRLGKAVTWIVRKLGTEKTTVDVHLPDYASVLLGSAEIPPLEISVVDGVITTVDFVANLAPGEVEGLRSIANQWLDGQLDFLRLQAVADIPLRSGVIPLGTHSVSEILVFEANKIPALPKYNIDRINFEEVDVPGQTSKVMAAQVLLSAFNRFPLQLDVPPLGFEILVPNCSPLDSYILVAKARTAPIAVHPASVVSVEVNGTVRELPQSLTTLCPNSKSSPLDLLLDRYLHGDTATIYVRGQKGHSDDTPDWISDILSSVTLPVPFPGRTFDNLLRNFSLTDVHFTLPDPLAEPGDPASNPTVSGTILVTAGLPSEMNFAINVTNVRANADVFYHGDKLGELDLHKWQPANSTMHRATEEHEATLTIQSRIEDAPLNVTDGDVLSEVIQELIFRGQEIELDINALVDIRIHTILGKLVLKDVPATGKIPVKPLPHGSFASLSPQVGDIVIMETTPSSFTFEAHVNITNPTEYTAHIPFFSIQIFCNETIVGIARAESLDLRSGNNTNLVVSATWSPSMGGKQGKEIGRNVLSEFVSGLNTTLVVKTHRQSIPSQPLLGDALSKLNFTLRAPKLQLPGPGRDDDDKEGMGDHSFIQDATFHVFSSTASFILASPLSKNTLYVETINATAYYNHSEPVGTIISNHAFPATPGLSSTPKLPVTWSPDSVGFDKVRKALGGDLQLDAEAVVGIRLGAWQETIWYMGHGIGARVRM